MRTGRGGRPVIFFNTEYENKMKFEEEENI
jgi:hypothetical protein